MIVCMTERTSCSFTRKSPDMKKILSKATRNNVERITGQEAIRVGRGSDAAVVRVVELERHQVLEAVIFEDGCAL